MPDLPEKEILNQLFAEEEQYPIEVKEESPKIEKEIEPLIKKVEEEIFLSKPITDDYGQPLVSPPAPQNPTIVLPITKSSYMQGLKQKVTESIRWLAEWCLRLIKIFGKNISFRKEEGVNESVA